VSRLRVGVLVSGQGSNLQALSNAAKDPQYPARVVLVCANKPCPAIDIAKKAGISRHVFPLTDYPDRKHRDVAMARALHDHDVDLVVCAGYDAVLEHAFVREFEGRIINVHPSLLPDFAGTMDAVQMALQAGVPESGCTIHVVTDDVDRGPILEQRRVAIRPGDTVESLRARIQAEEHQLLPQVVKKIAGQALPLSV
jgi:phosphoribosylglycinamide formyltransferase-1